jgi:ABC-2 type transport system ATP-binding protein
VIERLSLADVADRRAGSYSGGQRRRLDLGASLVGAPRLLLLDEPTTGLDPTGRRDVWDAVRTLVADGTDVLLTTHYLDEANELADHVVVIDSARLGDVGQILQRVTSNPARLDWGSRHASAPAAGGTSDLATVIRYLDEAAVAVDEIGVRRPTLDEVFLALTSDHSGRPVTAAHAENGSSR